MTRADAVEFFNRQVAGWNARDPEALARDYADDGTIISPIFRTVQGKDAILESFRALFGTFPDWQYIGQELLVDGDNIAQPFVVHATHVHEFMGLAGIRAEGRHPGHATHEDEGRPDRVRAPVLRLHGAAHSAGRASRQTGAPGSGRLCWTQRLRQDHASARRPANSAATEGSCGRARDREDVGWVGEPGALRLLARSFSACGRAPLDVSRSSHGRPAWMRRRTSCL